MIFKSSYDRLIEISFHRLEDEMKEQSEIQYPDCAVHGTKQWAFFAKDKIARKIEKVKELMLEIENLQDEMIMVNADLAGSHHETVRIAGIELTDVDRERIRNKPTLAECMASLR